MRAHLLLLATSSARALWPVALGVVSAACWVPNETGATMQRDIRKLEGDIETTQKGIDEQRAELREQMRRAEDKITEVGATLQDLNRAARTTDAGFGVRLDDQQRELQELRGQIELLNYRFNEIEKQRDDRSVEALTKRVEALENALPGGTAAGGRPATPSGAGAGAAPAGGDSPTPAEAPNDKEGLLAYGKDLLKANKLEEARGALRDVARKWPTEAGFADEAFFQIGESYFQEKKYRPALQEYIKVVEKFPKGELVDDAFFRIGLCSTELANLEDALIFFEEIVNNHPKSPLVKTAKKKAKEIKDRLAAEKGAGEKKP